MVHILKKPTTENLLNVLGTESKHDVLGLPRVFVKRKPGCIYHSPGKRGKRVSLFKVLQTNSCLHNCLYCNCRKDRDCDRRRFNPEELARTFVDYSRRGRVKGLFLSSGVYPSPNIAQERMLATIDILRNQYHYTGFIHAVILPGTDPSYVPALGKYCDRLSLNLEVPAQRYLEKISPTKEFQAQLWRGLNVVAQYADDHRLPAGATTQLIVGAGNETDEEILELSHNLYRDHKLTRVYYSGFEPVSGTPLEEAPPCPPLREARLYEPDFLLRRYGFKPQELVFDRNGNLDLTRNPKLVWAEKHREMFPLEITTASFEELIRTPGIGVICAKRIISLRKKTSFRFLEQVRRMGMVVKHARGFITLNGKSFPSKPLAKTKLSAQQFLWEEL